jgi:hypothetical protein
MSETERKPPQLTEEESAAIRLYFERLIGGKVCPVCGKHLVTKRQVGWCVYGVPCGCRMYQGQI